MNRVQCKNRHKDTQSEWKLSQATVALALGNSRLLLSVHIAVSFHVQNSYSLLKVILVNCCMVNEKHDPRGTGTCSNKDTLSLGYCIFPNSSILVWKSFKGKLSTYRPEHKWVWSVLLNAWYPCALVGYRLSCPHQKPPARQCFCNPNIKCGS